MKRDPSPSDPSRPALACGAGLVPAAAKSAAEPEAADAELRLAALAFEVPYGVMITDARGVIERVNPAFTRVTGYSAAEAVGRNPRLLKSGRHDAAFYAAMFDSVQHTGSWQGEVWNQSKSGEVYLEWLTVSAVRDEHGAITHYVATMQDISLRKSREAAIEQLAFRDPLTGLPNRRLLIDRLQQAMAVSARARRAGALMFIDLDRFKDVNDTLGHDSGDELLRQVAQRLSGCVRECDTVARLGGDEFVVMLAADLGASAAAAAPQARVVGAKILAALDRPFQVHGQPCRGLASIGVTLFSDHQVSAGELLRRADQAMYQAKSAGGNALRFYDSAIQQSLQRRAALEEQLRQALQRSEFVLHYQPVVDREQRLLGAEVLLRWQHPQRGLLLPAEFIAIAEDSGLIHALGRWVLETACAQLAAWATEPGLARLTLSVNVSGREFRDERFAAQLLEILDRSGVDATRLELELSERTLLDDRDDGNDTMTALRERGVGFTLDNFGAGATSLASLKRLPLRRLKLDRSLVCNLPGDAREGALTRALIELCRSMGLSVIAVGVETAAQRDLLTGHGCDALQGDLFGHAAPLEALSLRQPGDSSRG